MHGCCSWGPLRVKNLQEGVQGVIGKVRGEPRAHLFTISQDSVSNENKAEALSVQSGSVYILECNAYSHFIPRAQRLPLYVHELLLKKAETCSEVPDSYLSWLKLHFLEELCLVISLIHSFIRASLTNGHKLHGLKKTQMYSFMVLEAKRLKWRPVLPLKFLQVNPPLPLPASGIFLGLWQHHTNLCLQLVMTFFPVFFCIFSFPIYSHWI